MSRNNRKFLLLGFLAFVLPAKVFAGGPPATTLWQYQCIDTVKYSRDTARAWAGKDAQLTALIAQQMSLIKNTGANCVAIDTPYDPEFTEFLARWVTGARAAGLKVWFRGNLSGWEGWFNYPPLAGVSQHNTGIYDFITQNPPLFKDGDMFTTAPEPENGLLGNPFSSPQAAENLRSFMVSSVANCQNAFKQINVNVQCGFFSTNGDVAKDILDKPTVAGIGNLVTVDDYVKTAAILGSDLQNLHNEFGTNVFLGEFGVPIPDLQGNLTESQQATLVGQMLNAAYQENSYVIGINYWVLTGGSTALVNDDGSPRQAYAEVVDYYNPGTVGGTVTDDAGDHLPNVKISPDNGANIYSTDQSGNFSLPVPARQPLTLTASLNGYTSASNQISVSPGASLNSNFVLSPTHPSIFYEIKKLLGEYIKKF